MNKTRNKSLLLALAVVAMLLSSACSNPKATSTRGIARVFCDESFKNILKQEIEVFEYTYPDASIMDYYMDEAAALDSLRNEKVDLIIISRDLTKDEKDLLKSQGRAYRTRNIAVDAVALIVNKQNDIDELSMNDLREIFSGEAKRWGDLYPSRLKNDSIRVVFDSSGSGVAHYMRDNFLNGGNFGANVYAQKSTEDVFAAVEKSRNAIGFVGVSWISANMKNVTIPIDQRVEDLKNNNEVSAIDFTDRIKVVPVRGDDKVRGEKPYQVHINSGDYPLVRKIWAVDASFNGMTEHGFYTFITGVIGQKIILQTGVLPAAEPVRMVETYRP